MVICILKPRNDIGRQSVELAEGRILGREMFIDKSESAGSVVLLNVLYSKISELEKILTIDNLKLYPYELLAVCQYMQHWGHP